jgi:hypothetical protein
MAIGGEEKKLVSSVSTLGTFMALIQAASTLATLFLISQILSNIPTINLFGVPITLVGQSLGLHIKFFTLWLVYILIVVLSIYGISRIITTVQQHGQGIINILRKVFEF